MDIAATVLAKGRVTIPKAVRDALGLAEGDRVLFRVQDGEVMLTRTPGLLELAGSVSVPEDVRGLSWSAVRDRAHRTPGAGER